MSDEAMAAVEQAAEVVAAAQAERYVPLSPATQRRIAGLYAQINATLLIALEALGAEGQILGYDPQTGMVRLAG